MAPADTASCLVRLITLLSAALGSMGWWVPQQRISWLGTLHGQWLITGAVSSLARLHWGEGERQSVCVSVWVWFRSKIRVIYFAAVSGADTGFTGLSSFCMFGKESRQMQWIWSLRIRKCQNVTSPVTLTFDPWGETGSWSLQQPLKQQKTTQLLLLAVNNE